MLVIIIIIIIIIIKHGKGYIFLLTQRRCVCKP